MPATQPAILPIPHPPRTLPFAHLLAVRRDLLAFLLRMRREHGPLVQVSIAGRRTILVADPPLIEQILVTHADQFGKSRILRLTRTLLGNGLLTSEAADHRRHRRMIQPAFYPRHLGNYAATMSRCTADFATRWHDGQSLDIAQEMMRLTLTIVGQALFGTDLHDTDIDRIGAALSVTRGFFRLALLPGAAFLSRLPLPPNFRYRAAKADLDSIVYRLIADARAAAAANPSADTGALLSLLLRARDDSGDGTGMSDQQVHDEALTLLLAGHETTASALAWTWALLAQHPAAQAKLYAELDRVLAGRPATFTDLDQLTYTRSVLAESMRLFPPAYTVARTALTDFRLGPHLIPAGSQVLLPQYVVHRDPRFFPDPERFDPDRWTPTFHDSLPRFAYFPFGGGPRTCIGEGFAWTESIIVLATLAQHWSPQLHPNQTLTPEAMITLRPRDGVQVTLRKLSASSVRTNRSSGHIHPLPHPPDSAP